MKTATLAAALLAFAGTTFAAFAAVPAVASVGVLASPAAANDAPRTRAEVKAELAAAKATGELSENPSAPDYPPQYAMGGYTVPRAHIPEGFFDTARAAAPATGAAVH